MSGDAVVRHRDKLVSRGMAAALAVPAVFVLVLTVVIGVGNAAASRPVPPQALPFVLAGMVAFALLYALLAVTFAVLRTVVTDREVNVKFGLWGPRIPLDAITACKVVPYDWTKFGGWGIRRNRGGTWAYVAGNGDVVEIAYTEGGKDKRVLVGAAEPGTLAAEIERARQASSRLRVSADGAVEAETASAAEEALDAERAAPMAPKRAD
jgi:hypothetical protein